MLLEQMLKEIPKPDKINAVLFDWGDVLMTYEGLYRECAKYFGVEEQQFWNAFEKHCSDFENGHDEMQIWQKVADELGVDTPKQPIWLDAFKSVYKLNENLFTYVESLKAQGYKIALLTNTEVSLMHFIQEQRRGRYRIFDEIVYSCEQEVMQRKPQRKMFDVALKRLKIKPEEALFIDDKKANVETANSLGIKGVVYQNSHQAINEVNAYLKAALD